MLCGNSLQTVSVHWNLAGPSVQEHGGSCNCRCPSFWLRCGLSMNKCTQPDICHHRHQAAVNKPLSGHAIHTGVSCRGERRLPMPPKSWAQSLCDFCGLHMHAWTGSGADGFAAVTLPPDHAHVLICVGCKRIFIEGYIFDLLQESTDGEMHRALASLISEIYD